MPGFHGLSSEDEPPPPREIELDAALRQSENCWFLLAFGEETAQICAEATWNRRFELEAWPTQGPSSCPGFAGVS